jgi:2',3'-cyclic-nucleotide 2'-phosphodiesterase
MENINILAVGDIVGRPGREVLRKNLPKLKDLYDIEFIIANGENSAHGKGITPDIANELLFYDINVVTSGNHIWANKIIMGYMERESRLIRPANYPAGVKGNGYYIGKIKDKRICVINLMGRVYMEPLDCPFRKFDEIYNNVSKNADIIIVDFHAEATSEKQAFGWHADGRATAVFGTHTHVQTSDETILPGGTGYITDIGMTGAVDSVLGMDKNTAVHNFLYQTRMRLDVASGSKRLSGILFSINGDNKMTDIKRIVV